MGTGNVVTVVGGGIAGLASAIELRLAGWSVTLLDKALLGSGASSAALGSLTPYSDHECSDSTQRLAVKSLAMYPDWLERLRELSGRSVDFDVPGLLEVAIADHEELALRETFQKLQKSGAPVEWLSGSEAREMEPMLNPAVTGGLFYSTEALLDIQQLVAACCDAVLRSGCIVVPNTVVHEIRQSAGAVVLETSSGPMRTEFAVLAPGADLDSIVGAPQIPIERIRGEVVEVRGAPGVLRRHLYRGDGFLTPRRDGRILLGSNYDVHQRGENENRDTISVRTALRTLNATAEIVPAIKELQIQRVWKGWRPRTPDGQPIIGWLDPKERICICGGFYGLGITLAPAVAIAVKTLVGGSTPAEIAELSPTRFN